MPTITQTPLQDPTIGNEPTFGSQLYLPTGPVLVKVFDSSGSTFTDLTTEANNATVDDVPLLPDPLGASDICYIGATGKFDTVLVNMGVAGAGTYAANWEYYDGDSWESLTFLYDSEDEIDKFRAIGHYALFLLVPSDISQLSVDGDTAFWIRLRVVNAGAGYTQPIATQIWRAVAVGGRIISINVV